MIALTVDEVYATLQFLSSCKKRGLPYWKTFWQGVQSDDQDAPESSIVHKSFVQEMFQGVSFSYTLAIQPCLVSGCSFAQKSYIQHPT